MRRLLPRPTDDIAPYDAYRPHQPSAPLLRVNMVASADGAATDQPGRTAGLGGPADRAVFRALRALADAILVGAGTARAENYRPHRPSAALAERRRMDGRPHPAAVVVVSRSLQLDLGSALFAQARTPTVVLTCAGAPAGPLRATRAATTVVVAGDTRVDLAEGVRLLREQHGLAHLLCEGGPSLNGQLVSAGLVDELCLTVTPKLLGTGGPRIAGALHRPRGLELAGLCEQDGEVFLRYRL